MSLVPNPLIPIAEVTIGPKTNCRQLSWETLVDFSQWPSLIPGLRETEIVHGNPVGRGTVLCLHWGGNVEHWVIGHWHPEQRLELVRLESNPELGVRFNLRAAQDSEHVLLKASLQIKCYGMSRLFQPLVKLFVIRKVRARFRPLLLRQMQ